MIQQKKIKAIIFDFGGVFTYEGQLQRFFDHCHKKYGKTMDSISQESRDTWDKARIGKAPAHLYWDLLQKHFGTDGTKLLEECIVIDGFREETYEFVKSLKGKYKLGMITNQLQDWFETVVEKYNIRELFDEIVTSYESGMAKPDRAIFEFTLKKMGLEPGECVFVDDMEKNIKAAEDIGMKGILFKNIDQLKKDLKNLGIS